MLDAPMPAIDSDPDCRSKTLPTISKRIRRQCLRATILSKRALMGGTPTASATSIGLRTRRRCHSTCTGLSMCPNQILPLIPWMLKVGHNQCLDAQVLTLSQSADYQTSWLRSRTSKPISSSESERTGTQPRVQMQESSGGLSSSLEF